MFLIVAVFSQSIFSKFILLFCVKPIHLLTVHSRYKRGKRKKVLYNSIYYSSLLLSSICPHFYLQACSTLTYAHPALISANVLGAPAPSEQSGGLLSANVLGGSGVNVNVGDPHGKPYDSKIYPQGYDSNTYPEAYNTKYPQGGLVDANVLANKGVDGANSLVNSNVLR